VNHISLSELAPLMFHDRCEGITCVIAAYFDESSDSTRQRVFTLAGYFARIEEFLILEAKWAKCLRDHNIEYFRAVDCENGTGPFARFRSKPYPTPLGEDDKQRLTAIKTDFVNAALVERLWGVGVNVLLEDYAQVRAMYPRAAEILSPEPYFIAYQVALSHVGNTVKLFNAAQSEGFRKHMVGFVFDQHEECSGRAKTIYDKWGTKNPDSAEWMASLTYSDDRKVYELQAADNLAFEVRKSCYNKLYDSARKERIAMTRLKEWTDKIYNLDKKSLEMFIDKNLELSALDGIPHSP